MDTMTTKSTTTEPSWNSTPAWKLPGWAEPLVRMDATNQEAKADIGLRRWW